MAIASGSPWVIPSKDEISPPPLTNNLSGLVQVLLSTVDINININMQLKCNVFKQPYLKTFNLISLLTLPIVEVIIGSWTKQ